MSIYCTVNVPVDAVAQNMDEAEDFAELLNALGEISIHEEWIDDVTALLTEQGRQLIDRLVNSMGGNDANA